MHYTVILNGPPDSGKDTGAVILSKRFIGRVLEFKEPIHVHFAGLAGESYPEWKSLYEKRRDGLLEMPARIQMLGIHNGQDLRREYIAYSENYLKRQFGKDIFGKLAGKRSLQATGTRLTAYPDGGFFEEIIGYIEITEASKRNMLIIHLERDGCTYEGDSRSYITVDPKLAQTVTIHNTDLDLFEHRLVKAVTTAFRLEAKTTPLYS